MTQLISLLVIIVLIYFVQKHSPLLAGLMAVIPIKIIATTMFSYNEGGRESTVEAMKGMLIGQFVVVFVLLAVYLKLR